MGEPKGGATRVIQFGAFDFDEASGELRKHGVSIKLPPQPAQLLRLLIENAGSVVGRDQIQKAIWGTAVTVDYEHGVNRCVRQLRGVFLDDAAAPRFIKTFPKTGYSFIAPIRRVPAPPVETLLVVERKASHPLSIRANKTILLTCVVLVSFLSYVVVRWSSNQSHAVVRGSEVFPLTNYPGVELAPSFSPDGRQVAFVWNGSTGDNFDIYTNVIGSPSSIRMTSDPAIDYSPAWSPDGRWIAFCRGTDTSAGAIWIIPAIGGSERKLIDIHHSAVPQIRSIGWSPDSRSLVISDAYAGKNLGLSSVDVSSGKLRQITQPPPGENDMFPAFSPRGGVIAFTRESTDGNRKLYLVNRLSFRDSWSVPRALGWRDFAGAGSLSLCWTQDGRQLVVESIRGGRLWIGPAEPEARATLLAELGENLSAPAISARGQLAFSHFSFTVNIRKLEFNNLIGIGKLMTIPVIVSTRSELSPAISPAGDKLAFVSDRTGFTELWRSRTDGSDPVQITSLRRESTGSPSWSPDGTRIVFDSRVAGESKIYAVGENGGSPVQICSFSGLVPTWSPDGNWIYFSSKRSGSMQVWRCPLAGGEPEQITTLGGFSWKFSPDQRFAYYLNDNGEHSTLYQRDLTTKEDRVIASSVFRRAFAPAVSGVYYFVGSAYGRATLEFYDFSRGEARELQTDSAVDTRGISLSPDAKSLFYGQVEHRSAELKIVEPFWR